MRLAQLRGSTDVTAADLQLRPGDVPYYGGPNGVTVIWRGLGADHRLLWRDLNGRVNARVYLNGADAVDAVDRLTRFGVLPWRPTTSKTYRYLVAVGV